MRLPTVSSFANFNRRINLSIKISKPETTGLEPDHCRHVAKEGSTLRFNLLKGATEFHIRQELTTACRQKARGAYEG